MYQVVHEGERRQVFERSIVNIRRWKGTIKNGNQTSTSGKECQPGKTFDTGPKVPNLGEVKKGIFLFAHDDDTTREVFLAKVIGVTENSVQLHYFGTLGKKAKTARFRPIYVSDKGRTKLGKPKPKEVRFDGDHTYTAFTGEILFDDFLVLCPVYPVNLVQDPKHKDYRRMTEESLETFQDARPRLKLHHY